jgi:hypothetical protein
MYDILSIAEMGFSLLLFVGAWLASRQASRLSRSGSAERLQRKARKMLQRTGWLTLPALAIFFCIGWMIVTLPSSFWEDRMLLNAPLIGAPLLAVWFTTVPMLRGLWIEAAQLSGPLDSNMRSRLFSRLYVLPYQATALGAATTFYFALASPVPYDRLKIAAPIAAYILIMFALWLHHERRLASAKEWIHKNRKSERKSKSRSNA